MSQSIHQLIPALAAMMSEFNKMNQNSVNLLLTRLKDYGDVTDGQISWMRLQAGAVLVSAFLGGATGIASAFFPKSADGLTSAAPELSARLNANSGIEDLFSAAAKKLSDNEFMRTTLKTAAKTLPHVGDGVKTLIQAPITADEAKRTITSQVRFQEAQEGQSSSQDAIRKANDLGTSAIRLTAAPAA